MAGPSKRILQSLQTDRPIELEQFWTKRLILVRIIQHKVHRNKHKFYRPASVSDLSLRDWWELVTWFLDHLEETFKILILKTGTFHAILRDMRPDEILEPEAWAVPTEVHHHHIRYLVKHKTKFVRKKKRHEKLDQPTVHLIMDQCTCAWEPDFILNPTCPLHNAIPIQAEHPQEIPSL